jgi:hypothetical protein
MKFLCLALLALLTVSNAEDLVLPSFDDDGWTMSGLWSTMEDWDLCAFSDETHTGSYFGVVLEDECTYNLGHVVGSLEYSESIVVPTLATLEFSQFLFTETVALTNYDMAKVEISIDKKTTWQSYQIEASRQWETYTLNMAAYGGMEIHLRFSFDSADAVENNYFGWFIEDGVKFAVNDCEPDYYGPLCDCYIEDAGKLTDPSDFAPRLIADETGIISTENGNSLKIVVEHSANYFDPIFTFANDDAEECPFKFDLTFDSCANTWEGQLDWDIAFNFDDQMNDGCGIIREKHVDGTVTFLVGLTVTVSQAPLNEFGVAVLSTISENLDFELNYDEEVDISSSEIRVVGAYQIVGGIQDQVVSVLPPNPVLTISLTTETQWPYYPTPIPDYVDLASAAKCGLGPWVDCPEAVALSVLHETADCPGFTEGTTCEMTWTFEITPDMDMRCDIDGEYIVQFELSCLVSDSTVCGFTDPTVTETTNLAFTLDSSDMCATTVISSEAELVVSTYNEGTYTNPSQLFYYGAGVYVQVQASTDASDVAGVSILEVRVERADDTVADLYLVQDGVAIDLGLGTDVENTEEDVAYFSFQNMLDTVLPVDERITGDFEDVMIYVTVSLDYPDPAKRKLATFTLQAESTVDTASGDATI